MRKTDTPTLAKAMAILAEDIESADGVANAAILEASHRLLELHTAIETVLLENLHLADGDDCTLKDLKDSYRPSEWTEHNRSLLPNAGNIP